MNKIFYIALSFIWLSLSPLLAVTAYPGAVLYEHPDGSNLSIRLFGDEFVNYVTTEDGYLLIESAGFYEYATIAEGGRLSSLHVKAHNPTHRTQAECELLKQLPSDFISKIDFESHRLLKINNYFDDCDQHTSTTKGLQGTHRVLVVLVDFPDKAFVTPNPSEQFSNLLNQKGYRDNGATGSAADYFEASTFGKFQPQFDVVGPYTLPQSAAYYGANVSGSDGRPREMIADACLLADSDVDFTLYDADDNETVDNVFVYYAGYNEAEGGGANTIWPHRWNLAPKLYLDGVGIYSYACSSELRGNTGAELCGIGTFVHEFSHVLGLTDLYATNNATHHTLGTWDVMDRGVYNNMGLTPPTYSAYERFYLGYLTPQQLCRSQLSILEPLITSNQAFLVAESRHNMKGSQPYPKEFYLLENRQPVGWDSLALPGHGLLITRVDFNAQRWNSNSVNTNPSAMGVDIIEADESAYNLAGDPFPGTNNVRSFDDFDDTDYELAAISEQDSIIIFQFLDDDNDDDIPDVAVSKVRLVFETEQSIPSPVQSIVVASTSVDENLEVDFEMGDYFQMRTKDTEWSSDKLIFMPQTGKSAIVKRIDIRYFPTLMSDEYGHSDNVNITNHEYTTDIDLIGYASPYDLFAPVALPATEVTSGSFVARWQTVKGATAYYLSVTSDADGDAHDKNFGRHFETRNQTTICVLDTFYRVTDLRALTDYRYQVSATNSVNVDDPEYVTELSNAIDVKTHKEVASEIEGITYNQSGLVVTASEYIYIYNAQGQLWQLVAPNTSSQHISLPRGQIFVVKSGTNYLKVVR